MLMNLKLNDIYYKMLWVEDVHTFDRVRKIMATIGSMKSPFEIFYGDKLKNIGSLSEFQCIAYVTKRDKLRRKLQTKYTSLLR